MKNTSPQNERSNFGGLIMGSEKHESLTKRKEIYRMAFIDKMYGNLKDAQEIREFLTEHKDEIMERTGGFNPLSYLYRMDWPDWTIGSKRYNPQKEHPIAFFAGAIDVCLVQMGNLPEPFQRYFEEHHSKEWFEDVKAHKPPFDFKPWEYIPATKYTFDWSEFKIYGRFKVNHAMQSARHQVWVDAYYKGSECREYRKHYGEFIWFYVDDKFIPTGWYCSAKELRKPGDTCSTAHINVHSKKALLRWVRKMCFPKGTELLCSLGWVGSEFKVYCK